MKPKKLTVTIALLLLHATVVHAIPMVLTQEWRRGNEPTFTVETVAYFNTDPITGSGTESVLVTELWLLFKIDDIPCRWFPDPWNTCWQYAEVVIALPPWPEKTIIAVYQDGVYQYLISVTHGGNPSVKVIPPANWLGEIVSFGLYSSNNVLYDTMSTGTHGYSLEKTILEPEPPENQPPVADAGPDQTVELETSEGTEVTLDGSGSFDPDEDPLTYEWTWNGESTDGVNPTVVLPLGTKTITLVVNDGKVDSEPDTVNITVEDTTPPEIEITFPTADLALQDGVTLAAVTEDLSGVSDLYFYIREPDGEDGIPIGYEELPAVWNYTMELWELEFDTTELPDGYYVTLAVAVDTHGNEGWSEIVPFSIRNWAASELLPASVSNKAGRTVPIKFSLRVDEAVDPAMPFVHNEQLEIKIYDASDPDTILHTSLFGDTSGDYRINDTEELYITNFKTDKSPAEYVVEIWRLNENFLISSFTFETVK
jgi:hypothetical protein